MTDPLDDLEDISWELCLLDCASKRLSMTEEATVVKLMTTAKRRSQGMSSVREPPAGRIATIRIVQANGTVYGPTLVLSQNDLSPILEERLPYWTKQSRCSVCQTTADPMKIERSLVPRQSLPQKLPRNAYMEHHR